jgi:hypothetical protein
MAAGSHQPTASRVPWRALGNFNELAASPSRRAAWSAGNPATNAGLSFPKIISVRSEDAGRTEWPKRQWFPHRWTARHRGTTLCSDQTAWPSPSGSCWRVKLVVPGFTDACATRLTKSDFAAGASPKISIRSRHSRRTVPTRRFVPKVRFDRVVDDSATWLRDQLRYL